MVAVFLVHCCLLCLQALSSMSLRLGAPASRPVASTTSYDRAPSPTILWAPHLPGLKRCNWRPPNPMPNFLPHCQLHEGRDLLSLLLYSQHLQQYLEHRRCSSNYGIHFNQLLFFRHKAILLSLDLECATESHRSHRKASSKGVVWSISLYRLREKCQAQGHVPSS